LVRRWAQKPRFFAVQADSDNWRVTPREVAN
jgi:hypothetical protein